MSIRRGPQGADLGYLLHKHPARSHELELAFGRVHMFYPETTDERCTFALLLDIDPVGLVRGGGKDGGLLDQSIATRASSRRWRLRQSATNRRHTSRIVEPLSLRKSPRRRSPFGVFTRPLTQADNTAR